MLAAAWLGRGFWGLLRGAGRRRAGGGARPLADGSGGVGGRHGDGGGVFCLAAGGGVSQRLLRAPPAAARLLSGGAGQRRVAGSGGAGPPDPPLPRERRVAGPYAELVSGRGGGGWCVGPFVAMSAWEVVAPPLREGRAGGGREQLEPRCLLSPAKFREKGFWGLPVAACLAFEGGVNV